MLGKCILVSRTFKALLLGLVAQTGAASKYVFVIKVHDGCSCARS